LSIIKNKIHQYYNSLANTYDQERFENSYGIYIDQQERHFLNSFFSEKQLGAILDLGCGTGRFMNFATHGVDFSQEMLMVTQKKFPQKKLCIGEISGIPFTENFDCIFSFHVIMHQSKEETYSFLNECHKKLNKNGVLIFDYPTKTRKKKSFSAEHWHGNNSFTETEMYTIIKGDWKILKTIGILFFPIHRIPEKYRRLFLALDIIICKTFLKQWASYTILVIEKK